MKIQLGLVSILVILISCTTKLKPDTVVAIQPLGAYSPVLTRTIQTAIETYYGITVRINKVQDIPQRHFVNIKSPRYRADSIIHYLKETKPATIEYVIGFTDADISTTKKDKSGNIQEPVERYRDWGVMGLGYLPGPSCVVSTFRLKGNPQKLNERVVKVALHELGHNFGLPHCKNKKCFMTDAVESIRTIDNANLDLCISCKNKIGLPH